MSSGFWLTSDGRKSTPTWAATVFSCSMAAGRYTSALTTSTFFLPVLRPPWTCCPSDSQRASLPVVVVLPAPCRPAIRMTAGGWVASDSSPACSPRSPPIRLVSSL
ncbi:Uncharacterised protein [Bordetella pertussis]|nr:Uncharacterised protein [Bordetella pertussis]